MSRLTRTYNFLLGFSLFCALAYADPDVLQSTGKSVFYGSFVSADSSGVSFQTDAGVKIAVPWANVAELELNEPVLASFQRGGTQTTARISKLAITGAADERAIQLEGRSVRTKELVSLNLATEKAERAKPAWIANVAPTFSLAYGDQIVQTWGANILISRTQNPQDSGPSHQQSLLTLDALNSLTEQPGSSTRTHEYDGELAHNIYLGNHWFSTFFGDGYHNSQLNLYLQQYYGAGIGKRVHAKNAFFEFVAAPVFVGQHFYGAPSRGFAGVKLLGASTFLLGKNGAGYIELIQSTSYIPAINSSKAWQIRGTTQLTIPINKQLSFVTSFTDDYLEDAPGRKNYSNTSVGINFSLTP